ncbi:hypothetical protein [Pseudoalteromonas sp. TB64]|uniref:hypothetical protein n=1 Tax=Pseudoalteromonas sp. TB64 TaxID=1938600 RepID=UPI0011112D92|nr:hypothetical protein [Pseudoalteromonas sp. TB64]
MTFDDDVIYPYNHVERLYKEHKKSPKDVVCHRAHAILVHNNSVKPYQQWSFDVSRLDAGSLIFPVGIGGILYPDGCFNDVVCNESLFMALCPTADDIWFKFMALKNGYKAKVVNQPLPYEQYLQVGGSQKVSLWQKNKTQNDKQLNALLTHDSSLFELLQ